MAITTLAGYRAAAKQKFCQAIPAPYVNGYFGSGLTGTDAGNTANGIVPVAGAGGFPAINTFGSGNTGYLTRGAFFTQFTSHNRMILGDCLFKAGAYGPAANVTLTAQPDFSARVPDADYKPCQLWLELTTAWQTSTTMIVTVGYLNENGVAHTTPAFTVPATNVQAAFQIPLAAGDYGVSKITSVVESGSGTTGAFNVMIVRPLATLTMGWEIQKMETLGNDLLEIGMPMIYQTTALQFFTMGTTAAGRYYNTDLEITNG